MDPTSTFWNGKSKLALSPAVKYESCNSDDGPPPPRICKEEQSLFQFCDGNLNFTTVPSEDDDFSFNKKKALLARDPMSHRIIEKRRRDRMNNCLADLSRLIPADYLKKGRGRIEKTEIIEMAIKHMRYLQENPGAVKTDSSDTSQPPSQDEATSGAPAPGPRPPSAGRPVAMEDYRLGYQECVAEAMHFLVELEGFYAGDPLCVAMISHLQRHCEKVVDGERLIVRSHTPEVPSFSSVNASSFSHHNNNSNNNNINNDIHNNNNNNTLNNKSKKLNNNNNNSNNNNNNTSRIDDVPSSPNSVASSSDFRRDSLETNADPSAPSQLRDILTAGDATRNPASVAAVEKRDRSSCGHDPALYKFKNKIKQRFTAEHADDDAPQSAKRRREDSTDGRRDSDTCSAPSPGPLPNPLPLHLHPPGPPPLHPHFDIPIFALHSKRLYYVPLTLDSVTLAPYLDELNEPTEDQFDQVLHPVTISVDFLQTFRNGRRPNGTNGTNGMNGCLPTTTWHQCEDVARGEVR